MKILYIYPVEEGYNNRNNLSSKRLQHIHRLISKGFDIIPFGMDASPHFTFDQVDKLWKLKYKNLMILYDKILHSLDGCDALYNSTGLVLHPYFVENIKQVTVLGFNDDPESTAKYSKPVASSYDLCAIGNIAEVQQYYKFGARNVIWQPMGVLDDEYNKSLTLETIDFSQRDIDVMMLIDKLAWNRRKKMVHIDKAFPNGHFYGRGWKRGYLPEGEEISLFTRSRIGLNFHNSTGPINRRLYYLPANGVLQICDNKSNLGKVYELNKEVIGFDTLGECIELTNYYINHPEEANKIAINGWIRVLKDYNEKTVYQNLLNEIEKIKNKNVFMNNSPIVYTDLARKNGTIIGTILVELISKYKRLRKKCYVTTIKLLGKIKN